MNSNEILNKYINLIDKGYCSDCNELNCIDNFPHSKITHAIRELQQENKILKENAEHNDKVVDKVNWENMLLKKENKELKQKYLNAVADYETTMAEKEQLNSLVNSCQEEIRQLKKQLEENKDKINWYENFEINKTIDKLRIKHNNQQKEFIEYLENMLDNENDMFSVVRVKDVLSKYKEIIGGKE